MLKPNVYFMIDASGSMLDCADPNDPWDYYSVYGYSSIEMCDSPHPTRWQAVKSALTSKANELSSKFNIGLGSFPGLCPYYEEVCDEDDGWGDCTASHYEFAYYDRCEQSDDNDFYDFKEYIDLTASYNGTFSEIPPNPNDGTPIKEALYLVRTKPNYLNITGDEYSSERTKAVVVITDAQLTGEQGSSSLSSTLTETTNLANSGIKVYFMGFSGVNTGNMQQLAQAGGTGTWYPITDTASIISALDSISNSMISCQAEVTFAEGTNPDGMEVYITKNGENFKVDNEDWERNQNVVSLKDDACNDLKSYILNNPGSTATISIVIPCAEEAITICQPTTEICNGIDDDCDLQIDEGCPEQCVPVPEICGDGIDNDCNGVIDDGCIAACDHDPEPEKCGDEIDNDCNGEVDEGCTPACDHEPVPEICGNHIDDDCDGDVDEGCDGICVPEGPEICGNDKDDDCNGIKDDGCEGICVPDGPEVCGDGKDNDCNGIVDDGCAGTCTPTGPEVCGDEIDNDCNGIVDDGCEGICVSTGREVCGDGEDNDCNGQIDEGCGNNY